jgi:hypothetical protein
MKMVGQQYECVDMKRPLLPAFVDLFAQDSTG